MTLRQYAFFLACVAAAWLLLYIGFGRFGQCPPLVAFISRCTGVWLLLMIGGYLWRTDNSKNNKKTKSNIMDPKHLETAERMSKKRRELQALYDLLSSHPNSASVTVTVPTPFTTTSGKQQKEAAIQSDTFNALMAALVEKEIKNIDEFVKSL